MNWILKTKKINGIIFNKKYLKKKIISIKDNVAFKKYGFFFLFWIWKNFLS